MNIRFCASIAFCAAVILSGCALTYQKEGRRGILGVAWVEYRNDDGCEQDLSLELGKQTIDHITPVVQQETIGLYLDTSENSSGVGFGYRNLIIVVPAVNAESNVEYDTSDPMHSYYKVNRKK
jgi:hypothetical protein